MKKYVIQCAVVTHSCVYKGYWTTTELCGSEEHAPQNTRVVLQGGNFSSLVFYLQRPESEGRMFCVTQSHFVLKGPTTAAVSLVSYNPMRFGTTIRKDGCLECPAFDVR